MSKRGDWGSMADRVQRADGAGDGSPPGSRAIKHCWVTDRHGRLPGLLLEWRRTASGFQGRVVHPVIEAGGGWVVVEEWLPSALLDPA